MHELSIARSIMDAVLKEKGARRLPAIEEVEVRVGALSGVLPESLVFCFDAIVPHTALDGCRLVVHEIPVRGRCADCAHHFEVQDLIFSCPNCGSYQIDITAGFDLHIACLVTRDAPPERSPTSIHNPEPLVEAS